LTEVHKFKVVATDHAFPTTEPERRILEPLGAKVEFYHCKTEDEVIKVAKDAALLNSAVPITRRVISDPGNPLLKLKNLVITPHVAWYSQYSTENLHIKAVKEVARVLKGRPPLNLVNKGVLTKLGNRGSQKARGMNVIEAFGVKQIEGSYGR